MKKFVTLLTTCLLVVMCAANVFAATADITYVSWRGSATDYTVSIQTNGKATDGVSEITFDANALTCTEADIVISENVDMSSVNIEAGSVKISYIADEPMAAGTFVTVNFKVASDYTGKEVSVSAVTVAHDANGNLLTSAATVTDGNNIGNTGNQGTTESTESTESVSTETTGSESSSESQSGSDTEATTEKVETTEAVENTEATETTEAVDTEVVDTEATTEVVKTPVEVKVDTTSEEAWTEVVEKLETITEEEELVVVFDETAEEAVVTVEFLEAVKEKEATVVLDLGNGVSWVINGATVTETAAAINFAVAVDAGEIPEEKITEVAAEKEVIKLSLAHDGDFGCEPEMKLEAGKENTGKYANLYYYNPETGELEFVCVELVDENGYVRLKFNHASDYVVVIDEAPQGSVDTVVPQPQAPSSSSNTGLVVGVIALLVVVIAAVVVVMKKKSAK